MKLQRSHLLYILILGMSLCWQYALLDMMDRELAGGSLSLAGLLLPYPLAFLVGVLLRSFRGGRWHRIILEFIGWLGWVVALLIGIKFQLYADIAWSDNAWLLGLPRAFGEMLFAFRPELLILFTSAPLWWLGQRLAYLKPAFGAVIMEFQFGMAMLVITLVTNAALGVQPAASVAVALAFFTLSLLAMALAHAMEGAGWMSGANKSQWTALLTGSVVVVAALGGIIAAVVNHDFLQLVMSGLQWIGGLMMDVITWLASLMPKPSPGDIPPPMTPGPNMDPKESFEIFSLSEWFRNALQVGMAAIWIGLILLALWRVSSSIASWLRSRLSGKGRGEYEPMRGAFRADLLGWIKSLLNKIASVTRFLRRKPRAALLPEAALVRKTYGDLLRWAASAGWPRLACQTPYEYQQTLNSQLPASQDDLAFVTEQYVSVRYGPAQTGSIDLGRLSESWRRLKKNRLKRPRTARP